MLKIRFMNLSKTTLKIYYLGTSDFAVPSLKLLNSDPNFNILGVITQPDKPVGRKQELIPSPVKKYSLENNLKILQPEKVKNNPKFIENIKKTNPDVIVVCAYGKIIPKEFLDIPKYGCINIHPSLLPKYRGASPIQSAILSGDKITGTTIMLMDEGMDTGDLLSQKQIEINLNDNFEIMHDKLAELSASILIESITNYVLGNLTPQKQDENNVVMCKLIKREDGEVDLKKDINKLDCQIRAYSPWPGAFIFINNKRIKIIDFEKINQIKAQAGKILIQNKQIYFCCKNGCLKIDKLQIEGKKAMKATDFLLGNSNILTNY